ncbi:hypothetical protein RJT34_07499 [Clitoria ternatea]|uniref:Uncharacterized protein n=1 Tax=Clitoria ternatea TaxID=43366 RepID=A0AAN9K3D9_CLITE
MHTQIQKQRSIPILASLPALVHFPLNNSFPHWTKLQQKQSWQSFSPSKKLFLLQKHPSFPLNRSCYFSFQSFLSLFVASRTLTVCFTEREKTQSFQL